MKSQISYVCQECGYESVSFMGRCPECGTWNSLREFKVVKDKEATGNRFETAGKGELRPKKLSEIKGEGKERIGTGFLEVDRVLGGGLVRGSVVLLSGDPGIGKSTLLLQLALSLSKKKLNILYLSGEESEDQIKLRAKRIGSISDSKGFSLLSSTNTDAVVELIAQVKPDLVVVDSIQTFASGNLEGLSGSIGQVRYASTNFIQAAKTLNIPVIMVGHVTKEGMVAGPMLLSHMVDVVLFMEGEKQTGTRLLRSLKNRFGPVDEVGIFIMEEEGMKEVKNPESLFLSESSNNSPGSALVVTLEGTRPFLAEIQSLAVYSRAPLPRRVVSGLDPRRVELLLAVLQKHLRLPVDQMDIFVNVAGGLKISDRAADLAVCLSVFSSIRNIAFPRTVAVSEVGLLGELRTIGNLEKRVKEASRLGFKKIISPAKHKYLWEILKAEPIPNS